MAVLTLLGLIGCGGGAPLPLPTRPEPRPTRIGIVPPPGPYNQSYDAVHYGITLTLPDTGKFITATARIRLVLRDPQRDTLSLDLTGMRVLSVTAQMRGDEPDDVAFEQDSARVHIDLPGGRRFNDTIQVVVNYNGEPDDGLIIRKNVHGAWGAFGDNWPDRARFWMPVIDHPSDKATVEFEVRASPQWEVVANGTRRGESVVDSTGKRVSRWRIDQPIPTYLMVIGATNFAIGTIDRCAQAGNVPPHPDGCVPVSSWSFPQDSANAARIFRRGGQMVTYYSNLVAPFPYAELAHVQSSTRFGGMENAGAIFYSEQAIAGGTLGEGTVSHETAHQWFGDAVTPGHWSDLWLSEGFATYFGNLFFEHADGVQRFREVTANSWRGYLQSQVKDLAIVDSVRTPGNDLLQLLNANSYNKGGAVLHMARGLLGDSVFFGGIRRYYGRFAHGTARTPDLRRALEEQAGRDLGWFFDQWVYRPGHPVLNVSHTWDAASAEVIVTIEQTQKAEWPTFRFPLELGFTVNGSEVRHRTEVAARRQTARFRLASAPTAFRVDPDGWLLHER
ncbi:MAG: M1 family aminopeptidase [Gemmatimonadota bacterium]